MGQPIGIVQEILLNREKGSARLVAEYRERLYSVAYALCNDPAEAEDLVFKTFEQVLDKIETCADEASFYAWMCAILRNFHRLSVRRPVNRNTAPVGGGEELEAVAAPVAADGIVNAVDSELVRQTIERMPPKMREVLILHYFLDQPVAQIARYLMLPMGTVLSRLHYARLALATRLGAKLKKPAVALLAAALFLAAGAAVVTAAVGRGGGAISSAPAPEVFTPEAADDTDDADDADAPPDETFEEIFREELATLKETPAMQIQAGNLAAGALFAAAFLATPAPGAVRNSVFDDVKIWYKGATGNAVGTADVSSNSGGASKIKNLPALADASSATHGGTYSYWAWRLNYQNQAVDCPYAGVSLASTPCMVVPKFLAGTPSSGTATVTIDGKETTTTWLHRRFCRLDLPSWLSDWSSGTVCSNWTAVLRFRSDIVNPASGNANTVICIGSSYDSTVGKATGLSFLLNTPVALADYACPRTFVGTTQKNYTDIKIKSGRWVDFAATVDKNTLTMWFCWNNGTDDTPTNKLVKVSETYAGGWPTLPAGCTVQLASGASGAFNGPITNGVYNATLKNMGFEGAFHQIAFWDRTLSDDEIRAAFGGGAGRPNLVQVGIEGNGIEEFATTEPTSSVANDGAWENLNPTLTAANPTATIAFTCPATWSGLPQILRLPAAPASTSGALEVLVNGNSLGVARLVPGKTAAVYVEAGKITTGENTLVLRRTDGDALVLDAVTLGGSWQAGLSVGSFGYQSTATDNPDRYVFHPACGSDEIHHRGMNLDASLSRETYFDFFVPSDVAGRCGGALRTRAQNTGGATQPYSFSINGETKGEYGLKGGTETEVELSAEDLVAGWNRACWKTTGGGYWANIDWHRFTFRPPNRGTVLILR